MLSRASFHDCLRGQLEKKRFGPARTREVIERFDGLTEHHRANGVADPESHALYDVLAEYDQANRDKLRRLNLRMTRAGEMADRFEKFDMNASITTATGSRSATPADVLKAALEPDPRSKDLDVVTHTNAARGLLWAAGGDIVEKFGKGVFGRQKGKAYSQNVVKELHGVDTGDVDAKAIAQGWKAMTDLVVDLVNQAGGSMRKLKDFVLPQAQSGYKLRAAGLEAWRGDMRNMLDWDRMRWPDGSPISPTEHDRILADVYATITSNGVNKIKPGAFGGRGAALGNMLENHRFLVFKDADSWLEMHAKYGEGQVFDVMAGHVDNMARVVGLTRVFGDNPDAGYKTMRSMALKRAQQADAANTGPSKTRSQQSVVEAQLKNRVDPMFDTIMRKNAMDVDSIPAAAVNTVSTLLTGAQLGSASFLAIPGDWATAANVRRLNGMNPFGGTGEYFRLMKGDQHLEAIAVQTGVVSDEAISSTYAATRYTAMTSLGPAWSRRVTDTVLRASLLTSHTGALKMATKLEMMGLFARDAATKFDDLPYKGMLERHGIGEQDWSDMAKIPFYEKGGSQFASPVEMHKAGRGDLFEKFAGMLVAESRLMVPEASIEGAVILRGTERADTLRGALLTSFSMYKNFPVSMAMMYGRLAMANPERAGRVAFLGGLGATMTVMGAVGLQMREVSKGKDPLPMMTADGTPDLTFLGKAFLAGGAAGILGDFLTSGVNRFGGGLSETLAGPMAQFAGDTTNLVLGDAFQWADHVGTLGKDEVHAKFPVRAAQYARRYAPGSSIWWARAGLSHYVFDALDELADPKIYQKRRARERKQLKENGNASFWPAGDAAPSRMPQFSEPR